MTKNKVVMLIAAGIALASAPAALQAATPALDETRSTLKEWVELKKLISEEKNKWKVEKETLEESITLLEREITKLRDAIAAQEGEATQADRARVELNEEEEELKAATAEVKRLLPDLEEQVLDLVEYMPQSVQKKLAVITQRIPKTQSERRGSSLSIRVMNVIGILTEIEKFNAQVTIENEIQDIAGEKIQVDTLYLGLAIAYYVDGTKTEAGYMIPRKGEWMKVEKNELAEDIAAVVAMKRKEISPPYFVNLPFEVEEVK